MYSIPSLLFKFEVINQKKKEKILNKIKRETDSGKISFEIKIIFRRFDLVPKVRRLAKSEIEKFSGEHLKRLLVVISCDPLGKDVHARFTTVFLRPKSSMN